MDQNKLIERCIAGDYSAWDEFTKIYYGHVLKCVRYRLKRIGVRSYLHLSRDITQEIFIMLWMSDRLSEIRKISSLRSWLAIVSINFTTSTIRKKKSSRQRDMISLDSYDRPGLKDKAFTSPGLDNCLASAGQHIDPRDKIDLHDIIGAEISKLVPQQSLALKLNLLDGLAQKDIAELLKIPENTVATLIRRGKSRLSKRLKAIL